MKDLDVLARRYCDDARFHHLVETIVRMLIEGWHSAEVQDALNLAAWKVEEEVR